jgi:hypothetical protein
MLKIDYWNRLKLEKTEYVQLDISKRNNPKIYIIEVYLYDDYSDYLKTCPIEWDKKNNRTIADFKLFKGNSKDIGRISFIKQYISLGDIVHEVHHATHYLFRRLGKSLEHKNEEELAETNAKIVDIIFTAFKSYIHYDVNDVLQIIDDEGNLYDEEPNKQLELFA